MQDNKYAFFEICEKPYFITIDAFGKILSIIDLSDAQFVKFVPNTKFNNNYVVDVKYFSSSVKLALLVGLIKVDSLE